MSLLAHDDATTVWLWTHAHDDRPLGGPAPPAVVFKFSRDLGVADARIVQGGRHPRIEGTLDGRPLRFAFPMSPSDWRSGRSALTQLRRSILALGQPRPQAPHQSRKMTGHGGPRPSP